MPRDYVPSNDVDFDRWLLNFTSNLSAHLPELGLVAADVAPLEQKQGDYSNNLSAYEAARTAAAGAIGAKNTTRREAETLLRPLVRRINNHPGMTDSLRGLLGLHVPGTAPSTAGTGTEVPDIFLESMPGQIIVHFGTTPANEQTNGKPAWAKGCNIYRKKNGESEYTLLAFETASPYLDYVTGAAADYTYVVRYRGTKASELGGQSSPMTIAASGQLAA